MANTGKRPRGATNVTRRDAAKKAKIGDLLATAERAGSPLGGAVAARKPTPPAGYQHNQTDLEFLHARAVAIRGGSLPATTSPDPRRAKNEVAIETLEIAHVGLNRH